MKEIISIVIPAYNEEEVLDELAGRLQSVLAGIKNYDFEIIIIDNGSSDTTLDKLKEIRKKDERFKIVSSSRNFPPDSAVSACLKFATGEAAVIMTADLQDPPEVIPQFIKKWEDGYEVVYGVIMKREGVALHLKWFASLFYVLMNKLTAGLFPRNVSDFRLIDKKVYLVVNEFKERNRFLRGIIAWSGFKQTGVPFVRSPRFAGEAKGNFPTIFKLAMDAVFSFSYFPLKLVTGLGLLISGLSFMAIAIYVFLFIWYGRMVPGYTSTITIILFLFGILFFILGIIGEYLARIYDEVKARPDFIIKEKIGV